MCSASILFFKHYVLLSSDSCTNTPDVLHLCTACVLQASDSAHITLLYVLTCRIHFVKIHTLHIFIFPLFILIILLTHNYTQLHKFTRCTAFRYCTFHTFLCTDLSHTLCIIHYMYVDCRYSMSVQSPASQLHPQILQMYCI